MNGLLYYYPKVADSFKLPLFKVSWTAAVDLYIRQTTTVHLFLNCPPFVKPMVYNFYLLNTFLKKIFFSDPFWSFIIFNKAYFRMWHYIFSFRILSLKLCVLEVWFFGQLLCPRSKVSHSRQFVLWYPNNLYVRSKKVHLFKLLMKRGKKHCCSWDLKDFHSCLSYEDPFKH